MSAQQDKNTLTPVLTKRGRELLAKGISTKKNYRISHVGVGPGGTGPDEPELKDRIDRVEVGGVEISDQHIHVTARIKSKEQHDIKEVGFYLSEIEAKDGAEPVLFALYSHKKEAPLLRTSPFSDLLLGFDLLMPEDIKPVTITNNALFHLPVATEAERGIVRLATQDDIVDGKDKDKVITPETLRYAYSLATKDGIPRSLEVNEGGEVSIDRLKIRTKKLAVGETESVGIDTGTSVMKGAESAYQKAQFLLSGGGMVTWRWQGDHGYLNWNKRFIAIAMGSTSSIAQGHISVNPPKLNAEVTGDGDDEKDNKRKVTADGVKLKKWEALYAVHKVGGDSAAVELKFIYYNKKLQLPSNWLLIGAVNFDDETIKLGTGAILDSGFAYYRGWMERLADIKWQQLKVNSIDYGHPRNQRDWPYFNSNWKHGPGHPVEYRMDLGGIVHLRGRITGDSYRPPGKVTHGSLKGKVITPFTLVNLSEGFRPGEEVTFTVRVVITAGVPVHTAKMKISSYGELQFTGKDSLSLIGARAYASLDGISFRAKQE